MVKLLQTLSRRADLSRAALSLAAACLPLCALPAARAQTHTSFGPNPFGQAQSHENQSRSGRDRSLSGRLPDQPSPPPVFTIPVEPLGFSAPGLNYLGQRNSLASLDFLDENRLLFTFRVPGLMHREAGAGADSDERQIRAVVLTLPACTVEAEALWTVHDRLRYLWMLKDGRFLLRDRDALQQGDAKLELKPLLEFPGSLLSLEMDPTQQFMVTNSREPGVAIAADGQKPASSPNPAHPDPAPTDLVVRILRRESGQVMLVSRVRSAVYIPINSDGYLESLRGNGQQWVLNLNYFGGGSRVLGRVDSICSPASDFVSQGEVLVTACTSSGGRRLVAMDTGGRHLWEDSTSSTAIWPLIVRSPDGSRLAWETLAVTHPVDAYDPLAPEDIKGQSVRVFDAATGKVALEAQASPALDAGGNVAISPSGRRVAVLNAGAIQVFDLPAPSPSADSAGNQTGH